MRKYLLVICIIGDYAGVTDAYTPAISGSTTEIIEADADTIEQEIYEVLKNVKDNIKSNVYLHQILPL